MDEFSRTQLILGKEAMEKLAGASVAVFGIGGVGSFAAEALARAGIGAIAIIDSDMVCPSNINRQLIATHGTIGRKKVEVMRERILDIHPECVVTVYDFFYSEQNATDIDLSRFDYIVDAIDSVSSKVTLIVRAKEANVPIISSMGAGNRLDPLKFEVADIYATSVCPLARVMRRELRKRGIGSLKVVFSREEPVRPREGGVPGSISFVPPVAGFILASVAVRDIIGEKDRKND